MSELWSGRKAILFMKKKVFFVTMALMSMFAMVVAVSSCSKDDDSSNPGNALVGTWRWYSSGASVTDTYTEYIFNADKTGSTRDVQTGSANTPQNLTWEVLSNGTQVSITPQVAAGSTPATPSVWVFSVSGNELTLNGNLYIKR
jgi:hypothetical protein